MALANANAAAGLGATTVVDPNAAANALAAQNLANQQALANANAVAL